MSRMILFQVAAAFHKNLKKRRAKMAGMRFVYLLIAALAVSAWALRPSQEDRARPDEKHLRNVQQLTFGGENAEAYFSPREDKLIFQSTRAPYECDQMFTMNVDGSDTQLVSTGTGRTTCGYFLNGGEKIVYASTHLGGKACPPRPSFSRGYVWPLYESYDLFIAEPDGSNLRQLTKTPGYDAEATVSPDGSRIVFTSMRDGDLELYTMRSDGSELRRLTHHKGYDGGAFFSADGRQIVFRAHYPEDPQALARYEELLADGLIEPSVLEIYVMNADGTSQRQVTSNGAANFCPYFHPDGKRIIFSSNLADPKGRNFDLFIINVDGTGLERITTDPSFDGFPMFSRDGTKLVFASNRNAKKQGETNIFLADWIP
jgi:Tol biopolymer transport system component